MVSFGGTLCFLVCVDEILIQQLGKTFNRFRSAQKQYLLFHFFSFSSS